MDSVKKSQDGVKSISLTGVVEIDVRKFMQSDAFKKAMKELEKIHVEEPQAPAKQSA